MLMITRTLAMSLFAGVLGLSTALPAAAASMTTPLGGDVSLIAQTRGTLDSPADQIGPYGVPSPCRQLCIGTFDPRRGGTTNRQQPRNANNGNNRNTSSTGNNRTSSSNGSRSCHPSQRANILAHGQRTIIFNFPCR